MNKKFTSSILVALMIAGTTSFTAFAAMANGTVVIGSKAFDLNYANDTANIEEITSAIVAGGDKVYVKDFGGKWISNKTGLGVDASVIPAVVYKNATGQANFDAADTTPVDVTAPVIKSVSLAIGGTVSVTENGSDNYVVSLAGKSDTDMFTAINLKANEKATVKISFMGMSKTVITNDSGEATISVANLLGTFDPQGDGISVKTLKSIIESTDGTPTLTSTIKDTSGNEKTITITITRN